MRLCRWRRAVQGPAPRLLLVRAPYYQQVIDGTTAGARRILDEAERRTRCSMWRGRSRSRRRSGLRCGGREKFDGYVALGCVVRGETDHYDFICRATMEGLMSVALQFGICMGASLLTVDTLAQAVARSGQDGHNNGARRRWRR